MALKAGVVSGEEYIELVNACKNGGYALAAVNCVGTDSVNAVLEAAANNNSDVIIQFSNGGSQFYAGQGMEDSFQANTQFAFAEGVGKYVEENIQAFKHQIDPDDGTPNKKFYDPRKWLRAGENSFVARLDEAFQDLGSVGRSLAK